jgi:3-oxoadipate enol-lactonase
MITIPTSLGPIFVDDQGETDAPAALLWPSLFTDHHMWDSQVAALRSVGWRTIAVDPPGHGRSPGPGRGFTMDECAEAALAVLDGCGVRTPVILLGTSWGGIVAPRVALRAPRWVKGMVLFNTTAEPPNLSGGVNGTLLTYMLPFSALDGMVDGMVASLQLSAETRRRQPEMGADLAARFRSWDRPALIRTVRSVLVQRDSVLDRLKDVAAPALIVSGKEDTILPTPFSRRMAGRMPHARHVEVPDAAHLVPLEAAGAANQLILDFVRDLGER